MTADRFRPYGTLLAPRSGSPDFRSLTSEGWNTPFEIDGLPLLMVLVSRFSGMRFTRLERHFSVSQAFIPIGRTSALVAVAAPTNPDAIPKPDEIRAFVIDGSCGYVLKRGTWHSVDRYPMYKADSRVVMITSRETQMELETQDKGAWRHTQQVDYEERLGVTFQLSV